MAQPQHLARLLDKRGVSAALSRVIASRPTERRPTFPGSSPRLRPSSGRCLLHGHPSELGCPRRNNEFAKLTLSAMEFLRSAKDVSSPRPRIRRAPRAGAVKDREATAGAAPSAARRLSGRAIDPMHRRSLVGHRPAMEPA
jgi:hypothetical protein